MITNIKAVLFDLDGTLADTAPDLGGALNRQLTKHGHDAIPINVIRPHASAGARGFLKLYEEYICHETVFFPGILELLVELENRSLPWGIVTNKPHRFTVPLIEKLGLSKRAACVVSGDIVPRAKPAPDSLLKAAEIIKLLPENIVYVGDDERDIQAARAANMPSIIASYGYLGVNTHPENWQANGEIKTPKDLLNYL
jgi:HAD superfamily hydrolase (TIGR01509 family)